ncbi:hypothetical protein [Azohydromonas caseinilytica]|nr:hypothetical protein [Azohydromonas caseinilytica]
MDHAIRLGGKEIETTGRGLIHAKGVAAARPAATERLSASGYHGATKPA